MTTIYELLNQEKEKLEELKTLKLELVEEKRLRALDESGLWFKIDFKALGATSEKVKSAAVKQQLNQFPNTYAKKKVLVENLESEIKLIRETISVMREFGIKVIEDSKSS